MKSFKIFSLLILVLIAASGFSQQSSAGTTGNNDKKAAGQSEQTTLKPYEVPAGQQVIQSATPVTGGAVPTASGSPSSGSQDGQENPARIVPGKIYEESPAASTANTKQDYSGPNPMEINPGTKQPETK